MAWSYDKLWIMLIKKGLKKTDLIHMAGISTSALAQMGKRQPITMVALGKICESLQCNVSDIVEYIPEKDHNT
jgi:DNA-binding Xre family transcriptional regulator